MTYTGEEAFIDASGKPAAEKAKMKAALTKSGGLYDARLDEAEPEASSEAAKAIEHVRAEKESGLALDEKLQPVGTGRNDDLVPVDIATGEKNWRGAPIYVRRFVSRSSRGQPYVTREHFRRPVDENGSEPLPAAVAEQRRLREGHDAAPKREFLPDREINPKKAAAAKPAAKPVTKPSEPSVKQGRGTDAGT